MDIMSYKIDWIHDVNERHHTVVVTMDISSYAGKEKKVVYGFIKDKWQRIKEKMSFLETEYLTEKQILRYESMSDDEWYKMKYSKSIQDFTDEEIVAEFNRRLGDPLFHHINIEVKAVVKPCK